MGAEESPGSAQIGSDPPATFLCIGCGYDLRGLKLDGPCPECGLAIEKSHLTDQRIKQRRPTWFKTLKWAVMLMAIAQAIPIVVVLTTGIVDWSAIAGMHLPALLLVIGAWLLTSPEGPGAANQPRAWPRILRVLSVLALIAITGSYWLPRVAFPWSSVVGFGVWKAFSIIGLPAVGLCPLATALVLRQLAHRIAIGALARQSLVAGIGLSGCILLMPIFSLLLRWSVHWRSTAMLIVLGVGLLLWIWAMILLSAFAVVFHRASEAARAELVADPSVAFPSVRKK